MVTKKKGKQPTLYLRLSGEEKARIKSEAHSRELSMTQYARLVLLDEQSLPRRKQLPDVAPELLTKLAALGNNLNQIAKRLNSSDSVDALRALVELEAIKSSLDEIKDAHALPSVHS